MLMKGGVVPVRDRPTQVEVVTADALPSTEGIHGNEVKPWSKDASNDNTSAPRSLWARIGARWRAAPTQSCQRMLPRVALH
jgi:hypothetical protein